jgi:HK97 family phage major capsid protein
VQLFEMKQNHAAAISRAEALITGAENGNRPLTASETLDADNAMAEAQALAPQIALKERANTLRGMMVNGAIIPGAPSADGFGAGHGKAGKKTLSADYRTAFHNFLSSGGQNVNAALYEGSNPSGGYAVPITVDDQIVPLAPPETSLRELATVLATASDIRVPRKITFGTAAAKAESGATANSFTESEPTLDHFTLSAYMAGIMAKLSWELAQDVPAFQAFAVNDMLTDQQTYEENLYISGTGSGQAQGLIGNVGAGVSEEPDTNGNLVSLDGLLDLIATLKASYHPNAAFLMSRPTSILIRKAQRQSNLFEPVFTRSGGKDFIYGYQVGYSSAMPTAARGAAPVLFGDFRQGYVIGDRGGSGINVKILDQPFAVQGQIALLAYRRTDGRVRRSEAIQQYNIAAS